jgi:serine/threonine protein kinase
MGLSDTIPEYKHGVKIEGNFECQFLGVDENGKKVYSIVYGTPGFAAPECFYKNGEESRSDKNLKNPFVSERATDKDGFVDIKSDIFSFGCVLWDVIHLGGFGGNGVKKDFARINDEITKTGYVNRDLHYASKWYLQELEDIILKCTQANPANRYDNYEQIKEDAEKFKKALPKSEENRKKNRYLRRISTVVLTLTILFFVVWLNGLKLSYEIALEKFSTSSNDYSESKYTEFRDISIEVLKEATNANANTDKIYDDILATVRNDGKITSMEFSEILYKCLGDKNANDKVTLMYINTAMKNLNTGNDATTISKFIDTTYKGAECEGYEIASAIANCKTDPMKSFSVLEKYKDLTEYKLALNYLARTLRNEERIANDPNYKTKTEEIIKKTEV